MRAFLDPEVFSGGVRVVEDADRDTDSQQRLAL